MVIQWRNEKRKLCDLVPWEHNPREINHKEAERLGDSLAEFGQIQTIAIGPDNEIYDGHQRKAVWSLLPQFGPDHEVDVRVASRALTDKERQKLVVYLHRGTMGTWDWDELANTFEVDELLEWGFEEADLQLDWGKDVTPDPGAQVDKAAELQEKWQVERGQVWQVGRHRAMCGDSTSAEDVARLMDGERAGMVWTDPPYGVNYGDKLDAANPQGYRVRGIENDDLPPDKLEELIRSAFSRAADATMPGAALYAACPPGTLLPTLIASFAGSGFTFHWGLVWVKDQLVLGRGDYHFRHENILYGWKHDAAHYFVDNRKHDSIFEVPRPKRSEEHPTMKPPDLVAHMIENSSKHGWGVYDPFFGSGTTLVACEQTGRIGFGMEIEPKYCSVCLERLTGLGLQAHLVDAEHHDPS